MNKNHYLSIGNGVAIGAKHHTRTSPGVRARIKDLGYLDGNVHATIDWLTVQGNSGTEDAFDLARRCVAAWESYLKQHGLQSPI